ncbi:ribose 1,5-bisphosphate isomerase [Thermofilum pendens]|uniref:Ribose 1,5-bisphosphate isomerase n=1 Tax=Thermofilum pendens (strain DSM 2475 / Hrk 5) TaxID=368408 RepID=A1RX63_THEPD|nr:ribose 1,5-bisphosphate isomerase [Thermofilum pendens]ABL77793.1 ribose 1,5-bisphosphate isomerase [Thermofilum pendens Hrk 5]
MSQGVVRAFPPEVLEIARKIRDMEIRGAGRIAKAAAEALRIAALKYEGESCEEFKEYMLKVAELLVSTRPTAVSLPNAVNYVVSQLKKPGIDSLEKARSLVVSRASRFIEYADQALSKISEFGEKVIRDGDTILTHCNSAAATGILVLAHKKGKDITVYATETRPKFQGYITAESLLREGVRVRIIPESAVRSIMKRIDKVVVGADTVAANGAVVNKVGTSLIALAARERGIDFFVATETFKFSPFTLIGDIVPIEFRAETEIVDEEMLARHPKLRVLNPAFDVTPPDFITGIITEIGIIPPQAASIVIEEMYGHPVMHESLKAVEEDFAQ